MKEIFNKYSPLKQVLIFVAIGLVSFIIVSLVLNIGVSLIIEDYPNTLQEQQVAYPIAYIILNFLPLELGFFLVPGIIYASLTKENFSFSSTIDQAKFISIGFLIFISVFLLFPLFAQLNISITNTIGVTKHLEALNELSQAQLIRLMGGPETMPFYIIVLVVGIITGIAEELVFRRFLFHHIYKNTNKLWRAIFISSFLFAILHFNYLQIIPLFAFGIALALVYHVTKSIFPGIICHATNNTINLYWLAAGSSPYFMNQISWEIIIPSILILTGLLYFLFMKKII